MNNKIILIAGLSALLAACNSNSAPGNDKMAELDAAPVAAAQMDAAAALANVASGGLYPGILNDADVKSIGGSKGSCVFRMTRVGYPSFIYGGAKQDGTIKLNGKLVMLPASSAGKYSDAGLTVEMREQEGADGEATMILRVPGAPDELGFRGYSTCNS
jgi:hypothetical protein